MTVCVNISLWLAVIMMIGGCMRCDSSAKLSGEARTISGERVDKFEDIEIIRYNVPGFESLSLNEKLMIYYMAQASMAGRDILYDQHYKYNLMIKKVLETIYKEYSGDRTSEDFKKLEIYLKKVWFHNGIHDYKTEMKFVPSVSFEYFSSVVKSIDDTVWLKVTGRDGGELLSVLRPAIFDEAVDTKRVNKAQGQDLIQTSSVNFYQGNLTQKEVENFYSQKRKQNPGKKTVWGLNSTLIKYQNGKIEEEAWSVGGKYSREISKIVYWLEKAREVAPDNQKEIIEHLINYYRSGNLEEFDKYNIAWVGQTGLGIDFINGFIETYSDPLSYKGSWESVIQLRDKEGSKRTQILVDNVQWFEDNSPTDLQFKKEKAQGISASVINIVALGGDSYPTSPLGINLPNAEWIREEYGSKSVTLANIHDAYDAASGGTVGKEFYLTQEERDLVAKYGSLSNQVHTDMHECLGHASGKLLPGVRQDALGNYHSTMEEARADLFALYYLMDPKTVELGIIPNLDVGKTKYIVYINAALLTMLNSVPLGEDLEEDHFRNRMMIARWVYEKGASGKVIEQVKKDGKTYYRINDFVKLRSLFGELLAEVQRIKSTGDYEGAKNLVETYGVKIDPEIHKEVIDRFKTLDVPKMRGFVNPRYTLKKDEAGNIIDVLIDFDQGYVDQMMECSDLYSGVIQ